MLHKSSFDSYYPGSSPSSPGTVKPAPGGASEGFDVPRLHISRRKFAEILPNLRRFIVNVTPNVFVKCAFEIFMKVSIVTLYYITRLK